MFSLLWVVFFTVLPLRMAVLPMPISNPEIWGWIGFGVLLGVVGFLLERQQRKELKALRNGIEALLVQLAEQRKVSSAAPGHVQPPIQLPPVIAANPRLRAIAYALNLQAEPVKTTATMDLEVKRAADKRNSQ